MTCKVRQMIKSINYYTLNPRVVGSTPTWVTKKLASVKQFAQNLANLANLFHT